MFSSSSLHVHDALQIGQVGLQPRNLILVEHAAHTLDGILACGGPDDELADHGVVVDGDFVTLVDVAVDADTDAVRLGQLLDNAGRGHEVVLRVLGTDAALDGVAALEEFFLMQVQHFVVGDADLLLHQVHAHHFLRDGMLHLQAGIHFEEIEVTVLVHQELDGARAAVVHRLGCGHGLFAHFAAQLRRQEGRGAFLHNLLVTPLHGAFAVEEVDDVAERAVL